MDTTYILAYLDTLNQNRDQVKGHNLFPNVQVEYPMAVPETIEKLVMQFS